MFKLMIKLNSVLSTIGSNAGSIILNWEDMHCMNWEEINRRWEVWQNLPCDNLWCKITTKWEELTNNWEDIN